LKFTLRADDTEAIGAFAERISDSLRQLEFSEHDIEAFRVTLHELVDNVATHVHGEKTVWLASHHFESPLKSRPVYREGIALTVADTGKGFDLDNTLIRSEAELIERGVEHGLLRAYRLGSDLFQASSEPHTISWRKEQTPHNVPTVFVTGQVPEIVVV
jgi:anti-sigma regulatory factor (Ser/Thr protein kinase)